MASDLRPLHPLMDLLCFPGHFEASVHYVVTDVLSKAMIEDYRHGYTRTLWIAHSSFTHTQRGARGPVKKKNITIIEVTFGKA